MEVAPGARFGWVGLAVAGTAMVIGIALVPTHVSFGAGSIRCGTVLHPDRTIEVARYCGPAGAHQLRSVVVLGAVLALLALVPAAIGRLRPGPLRIAAWVLWGTLFPVLAVVGVALLGLLEYSPPGTSLLL